MRLIKTTVLSGVALAALVVVASGASALRGQPPQFDVVVADDVDAENRELADLSNAYSTSVASLALCVGAIDPLPVGVTSIEVLEGARSADGFEIPLRYRFVHDEGAGVNAASPNSDHQALISACEVSSGYAEASSRYRDAYVHDARSITSSIEILAQCMRDAGTWTRGIASSASISNVRPLLAEYIEDHGVTESLQQCAAKSPAAFAVADR